MKAWLFVSINDSQPPPDKFLCMKFYGLGLNFTLINKHFYSLAVYRDFNSNSFLFIDALERYFNNNDKISISLEDVNIDLLQKVIVVNGYFVFLIGYGFFQGIGNPTRVTNNSMFCLD